MEKAANEDLMVKQEPSEIVFPLIKEESANKLPANGDVCMKQEPSELGFPPIKEELDEPPADGDVCVKQEPSELGFPPIKEELDEPSSGAGVTWLVVVVQCEDSWQPEPRSSSASQDYTLCKQQVKEEITIEEHPIVAGTCNSLHLPIHLLYFFRRSDVKVAIFRRLKYNYVKLN
ncbi:uncharacterized protein LOC134541313 isoform X14 [Bacillus rossius redtenbacheri]|uniref:uncharacterized protein LOC134541313 isoform X14 n=1 Tax=Bacillus rossius redtenbacheri TaxID=93214 RepID=UPI002FDC9F87